MKLLCSFFCLHLAMGWGFNLFGVPVTVIGTEDLHDGLNVEDADERDQVQRTQEDYVEYEHLNHETGEQMSEWTLHTWNNKQHWWQRH